MYNICLLFYHTNVSNEYIVIDLVIISGKDTGRHSGYDESHLVLVRSYI